MLRRLWLTVKRYKKTKPKRNVAAAKSILRV